MCSFLHTGNYLWNHNEKICQTMLQMNYLNIIVLKYLYRTIPFKIFYDQQIMQIVPRKLFLRTKLVSGEETFPIFI